MRSYGIAVAAALLAITVPGCASNATSSGTDTTDTGIGATSGDLRSSFEGMTVSKSGGIAGVSDEITIDGTLKASVTMGGRPATKPAPIPATEADALLEALAAWVEDSPEAVQNGDCVDCFGYAIKVRWSGREFAVEANDVGATHATRQVLRHVNTIMTAMTR